MWKLSATVIDYCEFVLLVTPSAISLQSAWLLIIVDVGTIAHSYSILLKVRCQYTYR